MSQPSALTNTSYVVLGFLAPHPHSGYEIKQIADHSTRFFWQISYGQIYPELKRLVELGLAERESGSRGGRARHLYRITDEGREVLAAWLAEPSDQPLEMRDEMLLKLFFSDHADLGVKRAIVQGLLRREEATVAEFRSLQKHANLRGSSTLQVLMAGIRMHESFLQHLRDVEAELS